MAATVNYWPTVGSGGSDGATLTWISTVADFVATKDATLTKINWWSSCSTLNDFDRAVPSIGTTGATELVRITGSTSLKLRLSSGAGTTSYRLLRNRVQAQNGAASVYNNLCANARTSHWALACKVIVNAVTATCGQQIIGMSDEATQSTYMGVDGGTSQTTFSMKIGSAAAIDTATAIGTLGTTEHTLVMVCDGTTVSGYIDLVTTAVASGLSNTGANAAGHFASLPNNGATAANSEFDLLGVVAFGA